jgi:dTDP-4-dehydrorhamnose reductase
VRLLVIGGGGQVGSAVAALAQAAGDAVDAPAHAALDLADAAALALALDAARPEIIVNAAAYTAVDRAEGDRPTAMRVNAEAPGALARLCAARGVALVHFSTDYVFDGAKPTPYREDDAAAPLNVYGESKLAGEREIAASGARHAIVRTSWVFAARGQNFVRTMLRLAATRDEVAVVDDQVGCPTAAEDVAATALALARALHAGRDVPSLLHWSGAEAMSWHDFAAAIFASAARHGAKRPRLRPIATAEFPTPARRPQRSILDCNRAERALGLARRPLAASLDAVVAALLRNPS